MISTLRANASDNQSLTEGGINSALFHSNIGRFCVLCLLLPIPIFAIIGNLFIIAAFARFRTLRTPTNAFIVSLAVADFLVAVLVMPFSLVRSVDKWHFGHCFCHAHLFLDMTFCTTSIFNLTCVALDRYIAVCDPLHYPARMSLRRVAVMLLLCWILPFIFSALCVSLGAYTPSPHSVGTNSTLPETQTCLGTFKIPYAFATSAISFFIPLGFMLFAYGKILKAAQRQARWIHAIDHHTGQLQMNQTTMRTDSGRQVQAHVERCSLKKKEWRAVKTLGLIMGVILFCWLPFFCVNIIHPLKGYSLSPLLLEASMWLGYANSSLNPFLYGLFNKNYGHVFAAMLDWRTFGQQLRAGFESSPFGRQAHTVVTIETISR
ncbi:trace amine-associated receptor 1-like [Halichoeres trimaculatus]|uniref:trace amine-associated receptor 1-like n=1 Tax=Halichoeres trimaculatus TaxID=147232 RepID=UPI003D9FAA83